MVDDLKLIELVQQNDHLYNKNHTDYRDLMKKTLTWKAIGAALDSTGEICRKRFRCLRDRFNKERKVRQEEMLTDPSLPAVYKKMLFLWDHLTHRRLVPVATRLIFMPMDNSNDTAEVEEEIQKQIQKHIRILKEETSEMQNASNEEEIDDSNLENAINDNSERTSVQINTNEEENASVSLDVVSESICSTSKDQPQILCIKKVINSDDVHISDSVSTLNDKQQIIEKNNKDCEINNLRKNNATIFDKEVDLQFKKVINPKLGTKRKFLRSNLQRTLPVPKRKPDNNYVESLPKDTDLVRRDIAQTSRPSCNEAFCIIVKSYLDKITNPERLSAARLQILTTLHNELYSTYT